MGKESTFQVRTNLERENQRAYPESDEWLGVQNSVGARKHSPDEAQQGQGLGLSPLCPQEPSTVPGTVL